MQVFQALAGFSLGKADMVRRAMSKKKFKELEKERVNFIHGNEELGIDGAVKRGVPEQTAAEIFDEILDFANYGFNKSHAVCYALVAYRTAYLKCHYPREYMAALLTSVLDVTDKVAGYISECREMGIALLPPDVNRSKDSFTVEEEGIRFGLSAIKNIGRGFIQGVVKEREANGDFTSFQDFCQRMYGNDVNKRALENLIRAGAFDSLGAYRSQLLSISDKLLDSIADSRRQNVDGQLDFFGMSASTARQPVSVRLPDMPEFALEERLRQEREVTGMYLSGHPMNAFREAAKAAGAVSIGSINEDFAQEGGPVLYQDEQRISVAGIVSAYRTRTTRTNTLMAYAMVEDDTSSIELLCFSRTVERFGRLLSPGNAVLIRGKLSVRDEKPPQIMCDEVYALRGGESVPDSAPQERTRAAGVQVLEGKVLWLRLPSMEHPAMGHINRVIAMFPGSTPAKLVFSDSGKRMGTTCLLGKSLIEELTGVLGKENVIVQ